MVNSYSIVRSGTGPKLRSGVAKGTGYFRRRSLKPTPATPAITNIHDAGSGT